MPRQLGRGMRPGSQTSESSRMFDSSPRRVLHFCRNRRYSGVAIFPVCCFGNFGPTLTRTTKHDAEEEGSRVPITQEYASALLVTALFHIRSVAARKPPVAVAMKAVIARAPEVESEAVVDGGGGVVGVGSGAGVGGGVGAEAFSGTVR